MNQKKLKATVILFAVLLLVLITISTIISNFRNRNTSVRTNSNREENTSTSYNFNQTVDLDADEPNAEYDPTLGTDTPGTGVLDDYYDNTDITYEENKMIIQTHDGYETISTTWNDEGYALYVKEPEFGEIKKFILSSESMSATYTEVKMKDVVSYINQLSGLGFNEVTANERNNKQDYYIYSAKKDDLTVTINYEKGELNIFVF